MKGQVVNRVLVDANPATLRAFGVGSVEGLRGLTDNLILSPEVAAKRLDDIRLMKATGRPDSPRRSTWMPTAVIT